MSRFQIFVAGVLLLASRSVHAQDLDPRAYVQVPTGLTVAIGGFNFSTGSVLTDATLPVDNVQADIVTPSVGVARSFNLFGKTAQGLVALPYSWGHVTGELNDVAREVDRSGLSDMRLRLSVLLAGAPAMTPQQFAKAPRKPIVGTSLTVSAPSGQYYPERFINLGTNRWGFKPEVALSYPFGRRWLMDVYGGVWLFADNTSFYPGTAEREQSALTSVQAHISYSLSLKAWAAFNATWYGGGQISVNGIESPHRESNSRVGATLVLPAGARNAVKFAWSTGAVVRSGSDFTNFSIGWQTAWLKVPAPKP